MHFSKPLWAYPFRWFSFKAFWLVCSLSPLLLTASGTQEVKTLFLSVFDKHCQEKDFSYWVSSKLGLNQSCKWNLPENLQTGQIVTSNNEALKEFKLLSAHSNNFQVIDFSCNWKPLVYNATMPPRKEDKNRTVTATNSIVLNEYSAVFLELITSCITANLWLFARVLKKLVVTFFW